MWQGVILLSPAWLVSFKCAVYCGLQSHNDSYPHINWILPWRENAFHWRDHIWEVPNIFTPVTRTFAKRKMFSGREIGNRGVTPLKSGLFLTGVRTRETDHTYYTMLETHSTVDSDGCPSLTKRQKKLNNPLSHFSFSRFNPHTNYILQKVTFKT